MNNSSCTYRIKALIYFVLVSLSFFIGIQQSSAKHTYSDDTLLSTTGISIYVLRERSSGIKIIAQLLPFNNECSTSEPLKLSAGIEGDVYLPKLISFHGQYIKTYLSLPGKDVNLSSSSQFELGGRFHLLDLHARKKQKITLGHSSEYSYSGSTSIEHYIKARLPCRRILAARGGIYHLTSIVSTDMNSNELKVRDNGAVKTKDGTILSNEYLTSAYSTGIYIGLSEIFNMWVRTKNNCEGYAGNIYLNGVYKETFFDIIMASTSFDPFQANGHSYPIEPDVPGSFQITKMGWRLGKKIVYTRKMINMGFSFEIGNKPGVNGAGYYFGSGITMAIVK